MCATAKVTESTPANAYDSCCKIAKSLAIRAERPVAGSVVGRADMDTYPEVSALLKLDREVMDFGKPGSL